MKQTARSMILAAALLAPVTLSLPSVALAAAQRCEITFRVDGGTALGAFGTRVDYANALGEFEGTAGAVTCEALIPEAMTFAADDDTGRELSLGMISVIGVSLPQDFWRCTFVTGGSSPVPEDFVLTVDEALAVDLSDVPVFASVASIACDGDAQCGNGIVEGGEECDDGVATSTCDSQCRFTPATRQCSIGFEVDSTGVLGSLQFTVDYASAGGDFAGTGQAVSCKQPFESALTAMNDNEAEAELHLGFVTPVGLSIPAEVWRCSFLTTSDAPSSDDFTIGNVAATDLAVEEVVVTVSPHNLGCVGGPECGDGQVEGTETCDDGNTVNTDACTNSCKIAVCGDGIVRSGVEACDDGNTVNTDACTNACANAVCGDGIVRSGVEACDDGNAVNTDACTNACANAVCGDGIVHAGVEACDDGNAIDNDTCSNLCERANCGDVNRDGKVLASDALQVLKHAVGLPTQCENAECICDANGQQGVKASDALLVLKAAVGQNVEMMCPCWPA